MPVPLKYLDHPARAAAIEAGLPKWDFGQPCARGHKSLRYVKSGACCECNREIGAATRRKRGPKPRKKRVKFLPTKKLIAIHESNVLRRRAERGNKLPLTAAIGLYGYERSAAARHRNSYLNSLLAKV
jgi:hypothetical protein